MSQNLCPRASHVCFFKAQSLREHLVTDHSTMRRTPLQWVFLIHGLKTSMEKKHGKMTHAKLAATITSNVDLSEGTDEVSESMVLSCLKVHSTAFNIIQYSIIQHT